MIEADGLTKRFGRLTALESLDLRVDSGEVFGFLGPNGAGKSTATKIFCTLLSPTEGRARVAGFDVEREPRDVRRSIGYLPERVPSYAALTAREDLRYFANLHGLPRDRIDARIEDVLQRVGLTGVEHRRTGTFSKGMNQRLGIARAILHDPKVLFLDEPATGLDPTGRRGIRTLMRDLAEDGRTIFLCSHDLGEVRAVCQRVGFIRGGRLVEVRQVGEAVEERLLDLEVERWTPTVQAAVESVAGVTHVEPADAVAVRVRGTPALDRRAVARAVHGAGGVLLHLAEREESIESLYQRFVEGEAMPIADGGATRSVPVEGEDAAEPAAQEVAE